MFNQKKEEEKSGATITNSNLNQTKPPDNDKNSLFGNQSFGKKDLTFQQTEIKNTQPNIENNLFANKTSGSVLFSSISNNQEPKQNFVSSSGIFQTNNNNQEVKSDNKQSNSNISSTGIFQTNNKDSKQLEDKKSTVIGNQFI